LARLRSRCKGADIGYVDEGGHEIFLYDHPAIGRIEEVNSCIESILGPAAFVDRTPLAAQYGLSDTVTTLIRTPYESTIDSGKLVRTLWGIAAQHGAHIRTGAEVLHIEDYADGVQIDVRTLTGNVRVKANNVVVASNAWIPNLVTSNQLPEILPGRGQVLVTKPLQNLHLRGSFHYDEGYYYFRRLGDRVLLGGGRNMDFAGEQTTSHETTTIIQEALEDLLRTVIVPHHNNVEIEYRWAGTMAFTSTKQPFVERVLPHTVVAFGCNGMGVALSSSIAMRAASILD
jgi:glycine/D-amino acid oxidase-like deaminating enzyme